MHDEQEAEALRNFHYFQSVVGSLMPDHAGEFALLHDRAVVDVYPKPWAAVEAGHAKFADGRFSVQRVIDRPLDLGFMSYGSADRPAD